MNESENYKRLLAVFAHPDDESFGTGGTLALYASQGVEVSLVCATRGEVGEIADPSLATPETLPQVREQELRTAAKALGISDVRFLGYRDSGMDGTPDNDNPDAFIKAPDEDVIGKLVEIIRDIRPHVIVTFEPGGGYGHPDHMAISRHTLAAFRASGDAGSFPEKGRPWQVSRLFYAAFMTRSRLIELRDKLKELGEDTSRYDKRIEEGGGWPDEDVHAVLNVSSTVNAKWDALRSHRTQQGTFSLISRMPEELAKDFMSQESFTLALPKPENALRLAGLFDGI